MTRDWLGRLALRLVPRSWRGAVQSDLEDEARRLNRGTMWSSWQALRVGVPLRWAVTGDAMWSDLRYAFRALCAAPVFAVTAVVTFALGIGVNVAVFSAVDRLLFRRLPYANVDRLMFLRNCDSKTGFCAGIFPSNVAYQLQRHSTTVEEIAVAGFAEQVRVSRDPDDPARATLIEISPRLLNVLGVRPVLGRDATADEIASKRVLAWLNYESWTSRFHGAPDVIGQKLWAGAREVEVIGVLPRGFIPPASSQQVPRWDGLVLDFEGIADIGPTGGIARPVVRLRAGATVESAQAEIAGVVAGLPPPPARPGRPPNPRPTIRVSPVSEELFSLYRSYLWLVVAAAAAVLAVAAANLSTLLLVRGRARSQVAAICTALGASRARLARVALFESGLICVSGVAATLLVLTFVAGSLRAFLPPLFDHYFLESSDGRVLGFALLAAAVSAIVAGLWPAWRTSRADIRALLQSTTRSGRAGAAGGRSLLALEAALGTALVLGGVMCVRSFVAMATEDLGYEPKDLYSISLTPPSRPASEQAALVWYEDALSAVASIPGVRSAGGADVTVGTGAAPMSALSSAYQIGGRFQITSQYFETIGSRILAGRTFTDAETRTPTPVAMLNEPAARLIWPDAAPVANVGKMLHLPGDPPRLVVGLVSTLKGWYDRQDRAALYLPKGAEPTSFSYAVVRMEPGRTLDLRAVRTAVTARVGAARIDVRYLPATLEPAYVDPRFRALLLGTFAFTGLILAAIGLYAVASADVVLRRYETGVRLALGARPGDVARRIILEACRPVLAGVVVGLVVSYWCAQFVQAFLHRVDGRDPWTYALVAVTLIATAVGAAWLPAQRAASTDPASVLRTQ